jgi:hypothetical protein
MILKVPPYLGAAVVEAAGVEALVVEVELVAEVAAVVLVLEVVVEEVEEELQPVKRKTNTRIKQMGTRNFFKDRLL